MSLLDLKVSDVDMVNKTLRLSYEAKVSSLILPLNFVGKIPQPTQKVVSRNIGIVLFHNFVILVKNRITQS